MPCLPRPDYIFIIEEDCVFTFRIVYLKSKESYHVPNALAEASPLADARNVHDLDSSVERLTRTEGYVNLDYDERRIDV